ncbi:MAG: Glycosyl hydrolase family 43 [Chlorobi bacterium OLB7]|nr:MAG: Glycosyl hydrolase family 43 [Chlorobi bacterium OLB7]
MSASLFFWLFIFFTAIPLFSQPANRNDSALFRYVFDIPGGYVNDHCLIQGTDGLWHLYFIEGTVSNEVWYRDSNQIVIGHATSPDLLNWTHLQPALRLGPPGTLDAGHVTAPYVIEFNGQYYMYYVGKEAGVGYFAGEHMMLAISNDLYTWQRHFISPIMAPDTSWASYHPKGYLGGSGGPVSCRDAHVIPHPQHGWILYYVARLKADPNRPSADQEYSCVAAATSPDRTHWTDRGPVLTRKTTGTEEFTYAHPESPCVFQRNGLWYLFWKGGNGTRYVISDNPLDFNDRSEYFLATSHASEIFDWQGKWFITSCSRQINDVTHSFSDRTRWLFLAGIQWEGRYPTVVPLQPSGVSNQDQCKISPELIISPNPARNRTLKLQLQGISAHAPCVVELADVIGQKIPIEQPINLTETKNGATAELVAEGIPAGVYFLQLQIGEKSMVELLVLE